VTRYRVTVALLLAVIATAVLWDAAETRKASCRASGQVGCSLAPWSGDARTPARKPSRRAFDFEGGYGSGDHFEPGGPYGGTDSYGPLP
jgi:hypothetical protein